MVGVSCTKAVQSGCKKLYFYFLPIFRQSSANLPPLPIFRPCLPTARFDPSGQAGAPGGPGGEVEAGKGGHVWGRQVDFEASFAPKSFQKARSAFLFL